MVGKLSWWLLAGAMALGACGEAEEAGDDPLRSAGIDVGDPGRFLFDPFVLPGDPRPWVTEPPVERPVERWCEDKDIESSQACRHCEARADACLDLCGFGQRRAPAPDPVAMQQCVGGECGGCTRAGSQVCEEARAFCAECGVCSRLDDTRPVEEPDDVCDHLWAACDADCSFAGSAACVLCQVRVATECGLRR